MKLQAMFGGSNRATALAYLREKGFLENENGTWFHPDGRIGVLECTPATIGDKEGQWWAKIGNPCVKSHEKVVR